MADVPFGPYEPDRGPFNAGVLPLVNNVVPTADGWGPLPAIVPTPAIYDYLTDQTALNRLTDQNGNRLIIATDGSGITGVIVLPSACLGLFAARKKDGTEVLFAGTATKLYRFNRTQFVWDDVSSTTYAAACRWSFAKFGDIVYVQNGFNTEQKFDIENDTLFSDNAGAPICKYLVVIGNFLFRFNIVSWAAESLTIEPALMMCSALEDPQDNILQNYNWCDSQWIPNGDEIMGAVPVTGGAHVWLRSGVVPMVITMANGRTFELGDVDTTRGTSAPYSLGMFGQDRYIVYTDDGFWLYNGGFSPIGQDRINGTFLETCDQDEFDDVLAMTDPEHAVIWLQYTNNSGQRRMFGYQFNINRFTASDIAAEASFVCRTFIYTQSDPPILVANQPRFALINNGQLSYMVGDPMAATLKTNQLQLSDGRTFTNRFQLTGDPQPGDYTLTPITRDVLGGPTRSRTPRSASTRSGDVSSRANGKTLEIELNINAGADWDNVSGVHIPGSKRAGRA